MRFLVIVCLLCLLFGVSSLPVSGAPHQDCLPTGQDQLSIPPEQAGIILINEVLLSPTQTWSCPGSTSVPGAQDSWIELYNPRALSFDLYAVHATIDSGDSTQSMRFPIGSAISAHGFLTIFPQQSIFFHNAQTTSVRLLFNGGPVSTVIDQVTVPSTLETGQPYAGQSYARIPDGASKWVITNTPTIGSSNVLPTPTPKPKHTPTPKATPSKKKSSGSTTGSKTTSSKTTSAQASTTITGAGTNPSTTNGTQPAWNQMQLPTSASQNQTTPSTATISSADTTANSPPPNSTNGDVPRNMLIIAGLGTIAACALLWWRRWRVKHS